MWHVLAEEEIRCTECNHQIPSGADCLSQLPPGVPENFRRSKFKTFCISCTRCDQTGSGRARRGLHPLENCYVRHLTIRIGHTPDQKMTEGPVPCAYCGQTIRRNTKAFVQEIYAWPEHYRESASKSTNGSGASVGASSGASGFRSGSDGWHRLSPETQRLFQTRGLGRGVRPRSPAMAQRLYERSIPRAVRNGGDSAVRSFLKGKDASHIRSVTNAPERARQPSNIVWEKAGTNRARHSRNMNPPEVAGAKSANRTSALTAVARSAAGRAVRGGVFAAVTEVPVAGVENFLHWKHNRKSGKQAATDTAKSVGVAGGVGAAGAAVLGGLPLGPLGLPIMVGGIVLFAAGGVTRIVKAGRHDLPLDKYHMFFCDSGRCKSNFAREITKAARESQQRGFVPNTRGRHC